MFDNYYITSHERITYMYCIYKCHSPKAHTSVDISRLLLNRITLSLQ